MGEIQGSVKLLQKHFAVPTDQAPDVSVFDSGSKEGSDQGSDFSDDHAH